MSNEISIFLFGLYHLNIERSNGFKAIIIEFIQSIQKNLKLSDQNLMDILEEEII